MDDFKSSIDPRDEEIEEELGKEEQKAYNNHFVRTGFESDNKSLKKTGEEN